MTDFEMDKMYTITGREFLALLSLIPDGDEKAKAIVENVAGREKSGKVNKSQIDLLPCPFCKHTYYLEIWPDEPELVAEKMWGMLEEDLYKMIKDDDDLKEIWAIDHRIRNLIRKQRTKRLEAKE